MSNTIRKTKEAKEKIEEIETAKNTPEKTKAKKPFIIAISIIVVVVVIGAIVLGLYFGGVFTKNDAKLYKSYSGTKGFYRYYMENGKCPGTYVDMTLAYRGETYTIEIYLLEEAAPITTANFISYVSEGFYDGTVFHRIAPEYSVFQGGGFTYTSEGGYAMKENSKEAIVGEFKNNDSKYAYNDISHVAGVISTARTSNKNSATDQFFFQYGDYTGWDGDYAAFGFITSKEDIAKIENIAKSCNTGTVGSLTGAPLDDYVITLVSAKVRKI
ncbi:MAG: peptidylprolyl isomerase [Clostridia bacterium]|nr:peptidylprolyl isomerase [Clostridia bacterium]